MTVTSSTISGNSASAAAAAFGPIVVAVTITNSIVAGNIGGRAGTGPAGRYEPRRQTASGTALGDSHRRRDRDANGNTDPGGPVNGFGVDPRLAPLADNGGPTQTQALLPGSPAINAGDPAAVAGMGGVPLYDQRGAPWSRVVGGRLDIGAVESQPNPLPGDYNFDGLVDAADYCVWRDTLGAAGDLRADGDGNGTIETADYNQWKGYFGSILLAVAPALKGDYNHTNVVDTAHYTGFGETTWEATSLVLAGRTEVGMELWMR